MVAYGHRPMEPCTALDFARLARDLSDEARRCGLVAPAFLAPGPPPGPRALRRHPDGSVTVVVTTRERSVAEVAVDMVDGILAANGCSGDDIARADLLAATVRSRDTGAA